MPLSIPVELSSHVSVSYEHERISEVKTNFGKPYLDVEIVREDGGFICTFSSGVVSEHWYEDSEQAAIDADIIEIVVSLAKEGAQQINRSYKGKLLSSSLSVGTHVNATKVFGVRPFAIKKKEKVIYPAPFPVA